LTKKHCLIHKSELISRVDGMTLWGAVDWHLESWTLVRDTRKLVASLDSRGFLTNRTHPELIAQNEERLKVLRQQRLQFVWHSNAMAFEKLFRQRKTVSVKIRRIGTTDEMGIGKFWKEQLKSNLEFDSVASFDLDITKKEVRLVNEELERQINWLEIFKVMSTPLEDEERVTVFRWCLPGFARLWDDKKYRNDLE
jgi:hypothetical protein